MGYSHYFTQKQSFTPEQWAVVITLVDGILTQAEKEGFKLAYEYDQADRRPVVSKQLIRFNGVGDEGCETFVLNKLRPAKKSYHDADSHGFQFCKTRARPYDTVVVAILVLIGSTWPDHFSIGSDGDVADWEAGLGLAQRALPELASSFRVPILD